MKKEKTVSREKVRSRALYLLEQQDRTENNLRKKLNETGYPPELIEDAVSFVKEYGYVDDERYAHAFTESRGRSRSRKRVYQELLKRGIDRDTAEAALEQYYEGDERSMIRSLLQKKNYSFRDADPRERQRIYAYLLRRGFESADILWAMRLSEFEDADSYSQEYF